MIKAVFFDYDGVLTTDQTGSLTTHRYLSQATGIELASVQAAFKRHNKDLTLGKTTHAQIWPEVCEALGRELHPDLLRQAFESTPLNAGMFALARRLWGRCALGIITDNKQDRIAHLRAWQGLDDLFEPIVVSSEVGADKENAAIFLHALKYLGIHPEQSVFIDNNPGNLVAPQALGMNTLFHDDVQNDIQALAGNLSRLLGMDVGIV